VAHARLVSATPAVNGVARPPPAELRLKFSEAIELKFTRIKVTGSDMKSVPTGTPTLDPNDRTTLVVPLSAPLPNGKYIVDWQALSADGHKTTGTYSFESMQ
jgi:methionine-rich copper-binding protein CopC